MENTNTVLDQYVLPEGFADLLLKRYSKLEGKSLNFFLLREIKKKNSECGKCIKKK